MAEKIAIQIALEGGKDVEQQLAAIGEAGQKSFDQIGAAGDQANAGITKTGEAADKASESTSKLTLANVSLVAAIADSTSGFIEHAVGIGVAIKGHESLIQVLLKLVSGANRATKALSLIAPELTIVGAGALSVAGSIATAVVAFEAAEKIATKLAASDEKLNNTLQTLAATTGSSFDSLQNGQAVFEQIGIKAETFRSTIAKINETLAGTEVTNLTKGMKDIVELVNKIAAGDKGITFANWVTAEDKIKGVAVAMKQAADSGKDATQVLLEFLRSADLATSIKVGAAFGLSEADVDRVRRFSGSISDLIQRVQGAGVLISPEAAANLDRMRTSIQNADSAWARFKQSIDSTVFSSLAASFSATMNDMKAAALNGAAAIVEALNQAGRTFATPPPEFTALLQAAGQQLRNAVAGLNSVVAELVGAAMQRAGFSADQIQAVKDQINGVTAAAQAAEQAAQQSGVMFTQWGSMAQQGANTAQAAVQETATMFTSFGTVAADAGAKGKQAGETAASGWDITSAAIQRAIDKFLVWIGLKSPSNAPTGEAAPGKARGGLLGGRGSGTSDSNLAWVSRGEHIMPAHVVRQPGVLSLLEALRRGGGIPGFAKGGAVDGFAFSASMFASVFNQVIDALGGAFDALKDADLANADRAIRIANSIIESAKTLSQSLAGVQNTIEQVANTLQQLNPGGKARGGLLGGRGSGTSDSNLAWVSRGEYITPARAVAQPGVLAFLEALRRSGGNLGRVLDGMGRFALGGMVPRPAMAFAGGGLAGGMSNVTIQFPGLPAIGGLRASADVVDQLHKAAALAQVRSGGRKPSRYS